MSHSRDIEDADTWVAKVILLGMELRKHQDDIDSHVWRYSIVMSTSSSLDVVCEDWPGRCAKLAIMRLQERSKHVNI